MRRNTLWMVGALLLAMIASSADASKVVRISAGGGSSMLVRDDGTLWTWGDNVYAQLGDGTTAPRSSPQRLTGLGGIVAVSAAGEHSMALDSNGAVYVWGANYAGQAGDGFGGGLRTRPGKVPGLPAVKAIAAGYAFSIALASDGTVYGWGSNAAGQLGDGTTLPRLVPVRVSGLSDIVAIAAGRGHALALASDGRVYAWGDNGLGQLGVGQATHQSNLPMLVPNLAGVRAISAGDQFSIAVSNDGGVSAWGDNSASQLGDGTTTLRYTPVVVPGVAGVVQASAGASTVLAVRGDGSVLGWGFDPVNHFGSAQATTRSVSTAAVTAVASGRAHALALDQVGRVLSTGDNASGELGLGDVLASSTMNVVPNVTSVKQVATNATVSSALRTDGSVWVWGRWGASPAGSSLATPRRVGGFSGPVSRIAGSAGDYFVAVQEDGTMWGYGNGAPNTPQGGPDRARQVPGVGDALDLAGAGGAAIMRLGSGHAQMCSSDECGFDPGFGDVRGIAAGANHFLLMRGDGSVYGIATNPSANAFGQLGNGSTSAGAAFRPVRASGVGAARVVAGGDLYSTAVTGDGSVYLWGLPPDRGIPGLRSTEPVSEAWLTPQKVAQLANASQVAASQHVLALDQGGHGFAWGLGSKAGTRPRLTPGRSPSMDGLTGIAVGPSHSLGITADGHVVAWGKNDHQQLGIDRPQSSSTWQEVRDAANPTYTLDAVQVVEFRNKDIPVVDKGPGHYFITAYPEEVVALDNGTFVKGWQRTGRAWRAWLESGSAPADAKPVYRFFSSRWNSHFYTADESERAALQAKNPTNDPAVDWALESVAFYAAPSTSSCPSVSVQPRSPFLCTAGPPAARDCPAGYYPVYRAFNQRTDPNHEITSNWIDIYRDVRFLGFAYEGVAFCAPASTQRGGDLHAYHTFPADSVDVGSNLNADFWFNNAGPGDASGATLVAALPAAVNWSLQCRAFNGAQCPAALDIASLRNGVAAPQLPAGGLLQIVATGVAPALAQSLDFTSAIGAPDGAPDPYLPNNAATVSTMTVKAAPQCVVAVSPTGVSVPAAGATSVFVVDAPASCAWNAALDAGFAAVTPLSGTGPQQLTVTSTPNGGTADRVGTLTVRSSTGQAVQLSVRQVGASASPLPACTRLDMSRSNEEIGPNRVANYVEVLSSITDCAWDVTADVPWIIVTGATRKGGGQVDYEVLDNDTRELRSGKLQINNVSFVVVQSPGGSYTSDTGGGGGDGGGDGGGSGGGDGGG
jgi:alpha-tubulin suppressor-like RCC1 family protein